MELQLKNACKTRIASIIVKVFLKIEIVYSIINISSAYLTSFNMHAHIQKTKVLNHKESGG